LNIHQTFVNSTERFTKSNPFKRRSANEIQREREREKERKKERKRERRKEREKEREIERQINREIDKRKKECTCHSDVIFEQNKKYNH
jgi:hypothetical protein